MKRTQQEHENLAKSIVTFHINNSNNVVKNTVSHFVKQNIPRQTIYDILKKYKEHGTTNFLPKSGRPSKMSDKKVNELIKKVNNKTGVSQRRLGRRFRVHQSTISRIINNRTTIKIYKRKSAPKYTDHDQERRAKLNCLKLYKILKPDVQLILDDEKYFTLSGNSYDSRHYYTSDPKTTPSDLKYRKKKKYEEHLLVWMAISTKGISSIYVHRSKVAIRQGSYLNECLRKRLLPFINKHHKNDSILFWPDLASSHYSNQAQQFLKDNNINYVRRHQNPPNVPQVRPIETIWSLLEKKVYEGAWEAKSLDQLARRIILKAKELDQDMVTHMILDVRGKLLKMYRKGVYSVC
jgi:transposase